MIEPRATNFAENIAFARELFPDLRRATFVTKPNSIRRVALTLPVRWPGLEGHVDAPDYAFPDGISNLVGVLGVIDEMVGDLDRIMRYPALASRSPARSRRRSWTPGNAWWRAVSTATW